MSTPTTDTAEGVTPVGRPLFTDYGTAAAMLGLSIASTKRAVAEGTIPHRKVGRRVLIPVAALEAMVADTMTRERFAVADAADALADMMDAAGVSTLDQLRELAARRAVTIEGES